MNTLEFIASVVHSLAWPVTIVIVVVQITRAVSAASRKDKNS